jgi:hypothetical protein
MAWQVLRWRPYLRNTPLQALGCFESCYELTTTVLLTFHFLLRFLAWHLTLLVAVAVVMHLVPVVLQLLKTMEW